MKIIRSVLAALFLAIVLSGCVAQPNYKYYWGSYEDILRETFVKADELSTAGQIDRFNQDIQKAQAEGKPLPPGFYAHLGMLYAAEGQAERAAESLVREKELYPESTILIDKLLKNYGKGISSEL
ncbi:DUF4810 domain-containing protein [bacterium SCSIO 12696]|nr:DUF4810 domain-containing protein [bacterium SCSIO 12696]